MSAVLREGEAPEPMAEVHTPRRSSRDRKDLVAGRRARPGEQPIRSFQSPGLQILEQRPDVGPDGLARARIARRERRYVVPPHDGAGAGRGGDRSEVHADGNHVVCGRHIGLLEALRLPETTPDVPPRRPPPGGRL